MQKHILFITFIAISLLWMQGVIASPNIILNPSSESIIASLGQRVNASLNITNNGDQEAINISFSSLANFNFPIVSLLPSNASITYNFSFQSFQEIQNTFVSTMSFLFAVNASPLPMYYNVSSSESGFSPIEITIKERDFVTFRNLRNATTILQTVNGIFNASISPNDAFQFQFVNISDIIVFDERGRAMQVHVQQQAQQLYVRNPSLDRQLSISVLVRNLASNIIITLFEPNVTIAYNGDKETALSIRNNGNIGAIRINLSDSQHWMFFTENDFMLNPSEENVVVFRIRPRITSTFETNKHYNIVVRAKGENTPELTSALDVFVPFANLSNTNFEDLNLSREELLILLKEGIDRFRILEGILSQENINQTLIQWIERNNTASLTQAQVDALNNLPEIKAAQDRIINDRQAVIDSVAIIEAIRERILAMESQLIEQTEAIKNKEQWTTFATVMLSMYGIAGAGLFTAYRLRKRKKQEVMIP